MSPAARASPPPSLRPVVAVGEVVDPAKLVEGRLRVPVEVAQVLGLPNRARSRVIATGSPSNAWPLLLEELERVRVVLLRPDGPGGDARVAYASSELVVCGVQRPGVFVDHRVDDRALAARRDDRGAHPGRLPDRGAPALASAEPAQRSRAMKSRRSCEPRLRRCVIACGRSSIPSAIATIARSMRSSLGELLVQLAQRSRRSHSLVGTRRPARDRAACEHVVEQDQAARARPLERLLEVDRVAGLVGVDEDEVEVLRARAARASVSAAGPTMISTRSATPAASRLRAAISANSSRELAGRAGARRERGRGRCRSPNSR